MRRGAWVGLAVLALAGAGLALAYLGLDRGWWHLQHPSLERFPVRGIDVSRHQGDVDWALVADSGVRFAYLKATEGGDWTDPRFAENWQEARDAGLRVGAYHFFTFCRPPLEQAQHFLAVLPRDPGALPPVVDVEYGGNCTGAPPRETVRANLKAWLDAVEEETGRRPIIYVTPDAHEAFVEGAGLGHPLWLRSLFGEPDVDWTLWQYDARGTVPGVATEVDLNVFHGQRADFERL